MVTLIGVINMKKLIAAVLVIIFAVSAVSCTQNTDNKKSPKPKATASESKPKPEITTLEGIDVSSFNGKIDWKKVKEDGIEFAMIRIGGRGYGESGAIYSDTQAMYNLKSARKNKIKTGVYFFSQATSKDEAKEEAKFVVKSIKNNKISLPIAYDVEHIKNETSRIDKVSYKDSVKYAKVFMKVIKKLGYEPMVYIGEDSILKKEDFKGYNIWFADYKGYTEDPKNNYKMRQYAKDGEVNGIDGKVDLDILYK